MRIKTLIITGMFISTACVGFSHTGATGIVLERMNGMVALGKAMKAIDVAAKTDAPLDPQTLLTAKDALLSHSGDSMTNLFPEGSLGKHSQARPEIWRNWDNFKQLSIDLRKSAEKLNPTMDKSQLTEIIKEIGTSCAACHRDYRLKQ